MKLNPGSIYGVGAAINASLAYYVFTPERVGGVSSLQPSRQSTVVIPTDLIKYEGRLTLEWALMLGLIKEDPSLSRSGEARGVVLGLGAGAVETKVLP